MKPSERIKEIWKELDNQTPERTSKVNLFDAILQYLDEQDTHKCQCKK